MQSPPLNEGGDKNARFVPAVGAKNMLDLYQPWVDFLEIEVLEGLDGLVGVAPAARGVIEALVGEEVLIGGVEGGAVGVVQPVGVDLNCCGISG